MDLSDSAAYHGSSYTHRDSPRGDYRGRLNTAFLCSLSDEPDGDPDGYQFLETPDVEAFNEEIRAYRDLLVEHDVETVVDVSQYPNATYSAGAYFGFGGISTSHGWRRISGN